MKKINIDWDMFEFYTRVLVSKLKDEEKPSLIIGLSRGGLTLATTLSNRLGVPMVPVEWSLRDNPTRDVEKIKSILDLYSDVEGEIIIVDDLIDSGKTYIDIWQTFESFWQGMKTKITPVVILYNTESFDKMPYWNKPVSAIKFQRSSVPDWFVFPWE